MVAEQNRETVERLRQQGAAAVCGDAAEPAVLIQAHIARAALLVIATPDCVAARQMINIARSLNPGIELLVRSHNEDEAALLQQEFGQKVLLGEHELAHSMARHVLQRFGKLAQHA